MNGTVTGKGGQRTAVEVGMFMMAAAMLWIPVIDAIAKILGDHVPAGQVAASRFLFQSLLLLPLILLSDGIPRLPWRQVHLHAARGALIALATAFFFTALKYLPMADAIAIFFVEPLILTLLSALFLGETIGWRRMTAVLIGFIGALIVIRPGFGWAGWPALMPLLAAACFAVYLVLTRTMAQTTDAVQMQFWAGVFGCLTMAVVLALGGVAEIPALTAVRPDLFEWGMLFALGLIATIGHMLVVHAFRRAPAGVLAPFQYLEIISATVLGYLIFNDFPDAVTWVGVAIIVGAGMYVFHRERRLARNSV